ncbi:MAG: hypothetical protein HRO68_06740 [Nitrosopumilus sp.]|nr:hypothetical protein [Nitrosopumilus sp.]
MDSSRRDATPGLNITTIQPVDGNGNPVGDPISVITGEPTQQGTFTFSIEVTDGNGNTTTTNHTIEVDFPPTGGYVIMDYLQLLHVVHHIQYLLIHEMVKQD